MLGHPHPTHPETSKQVAPKQQSGWGRATRPLKPPRHSRNFGMSSSFLIPQQRTKRFNNSVALFSKALLAPRSPGWASFVDKGTGGRVLSQEGVSLHSPQNAHTHTTHMYSHPSPLHTFPMYTPSASPHKHAHRHTHTTCTPTSPITRSQLAHSLSPIHSPHTPTHTHIPYLHLPYTSTSHAHTHVTCPSPAAHTHSHTHIKTSQSQGFRIPSALFTDKQALTPAMHMPERHPHSNKHFLPQQPMLKGVERRPAPSPGKSTSSCSQALLSALEGPVRLRGWFRAEPAGKACLPARCVLWGCRKS